MKIVRKRCSHVWRVELRRVTGPILLIRENPLISAKNDVSKAEFLSEYFSEVHLMDDGKRSAVNCHNCNLSMGSVVIEKGATSRLLQHLKVDDYSGPDGIHLKIVEALLDKSEESLAILLDMSLQQSKPPSGGLKPNNHRSISPTSTVVKLMETIIPLAIFNYVEGDNLLAR